jgi:hydroxymethylglutaryl-CoA lyase
LRVPVRNRPALPYNALRVSPGSAYKVPGEMTTLPRLPSSVTVYEVGARDGLQNEQTTVPTEVKAEFIRRLIAAGLPAVELTSFVHPKWVPQLEDAAELIELLGPLDVRAPVLVPNERGLDRALTCGVREVAVFGSATETFAQRNLNRSIAESLEMFRPVVTRAREAGVAVRGYLSMCFGDPWEGRVAPEQVVAPALELLEQGVGELSLGDTIGVATPNAVVDLLDALTAAGVPLDRVAVHFHDTYGQALANSLVAVRCGVRTVDAAAGGLGGCPFAKSATGNLATEDLVWALQGVGFETAGRARRAWSRRSPGRSRRGSGAPRQPASGISTGATPVTRWIE